MTLDERIKASAEELGRLLREGGRPFQQIWIHEGCVSVSVSLPVPLDNGKAFIPKMFEHAQVHGVNPQNNAASDKSKALLEAAEKTDKLLQAYSSRDAFRIIEICKALVTARYGAIQ